MLFLQLSGKHLSSRQGGVASCSKIAAGRIA